MVILLSKSLITSLSKLNANDTKRVTDFIDKFYDNPAYPSIRLERVTKAKDDNLWSTCIAQGLRAIIYKEGNTWALIYAGQHDGAYFWARVRRVEQNAKTGALQIIEFTEAIKQQFVANLSKPVLVAVRLIVQSRYAIRQCKQNLHRLGAF